MGVSGLNTIVSGIPELRQRLRELRTMKEVEHVAYQGTAKAARTIRKMARANAEAMGVRRTGLLIKQIAYKKIRNGQHLGYTVGVRSNPRMKKENNPYYWWIVHFGLKKGTSPRPFLADAFLQYRGQATGEINANTMKAVMRAADRALKKYPDRARKP
jgi:hypothetical protein